MHILQTGLLAGPGFISNYMKPDIIISNKNDIRQQQHGGISRFRDDTYKYDYIFTNFDYFFKY